MCLPANATTNRGEHYWLVLGWHEILSICHKQSLVTFLLFLWHSPFQDRITDCLLSYQSDIARHCCILTALRRSILNLKQLYWFISNQEICLMSSQIVTPGPSVTSHLASDTGGGQRIQRMSPASPGVPWPRSESPEAAQCLGSRSGEIGSVPVQTPWSQSQSWDH